MIFGCGTIDIVSIAVALDMFPSDVTLPSGMELRAARVFVADGEVLVYVRQSGVPSLFFQEPLIEATQVTPKTAMLAVDGGTVSVHKTRSCGCGSPLKRMNPWPNDRRVRVAL